jgi:phosphonopyruvate decarboxylase
MIDPSQFLALLQDEGARFFTGVPDSLLNAFCLCIDRTLPAQQHLIASNEGAAVSTAIGYHLATGTLPVVYMQNSGLGNAINPLISIASRDVCSIPLVLLIGWRAEIDRDGKQCPDEPQHRHQGAITLPLLDTLQIRHCVVDASTPDHEQLVRSLICHAKAAQEPVAIVFRRDTFSHAGGNAAPASGFTREAALSACLDMLPPDAINVVTTGMASREIFELRARRGEGHASDFLTIGGMGHASSIALGISIAASKMPVICIDGDGALLMHMGTLPYCAQRANLKHIVINNGAHDSVGAQPTIAKGLSLSTIAYASGYAHTATVDSEATLRRTLDRILGAQESAFVEILCSTGSRADLGRPTKSPLANKREFMDRLSSITRYDAEHPSAAT